MTWTENLRGEQSLPVLDEMPGPYTLPLRQAKKTAIATENIRAEQGLPAPDELPDTRMPLPQQAQKQYNCDGEYKS